MSNPFENRVERALAGIIGPDGGDSSERIIWKYCGQHERVLQLRYAIAPDSPAKTVFAMEQLYRRWEEALRREFPGADIDFLDTCVAILRPEEDE